MKVDVKAKLLLMLIELGEDDIEDIGRVFLSRISDEVFIQAIHHQAMVRKVFLPLTLSKEEAELAFEVKMTDEEWNYVWGCMAETEIPQNPAPHHRVLEKEFPRWLKEYRLR